MTLTAPHGRLMISVAVALAVGAGTWRSFSRLERQVAGGARTVPVLVMRKAVPAGQVVAPESVEERQIPAAFVEPQAVRERRDIAGARSRLPLEPGEQLTRSKLASAKSRLGLSWTLPPGRRALALRLPAEGAVAGQVVPGDWVSVLAAVGRNIGFAPVVDRARVLAVQDRVWEPGGPPSSPQNGLGNESILVTLMLTPEQAARVALAADRGRLTLALVSPLDAGETER
jgi:pilus assembly protein CpaB